MLNVEKELAELERMTVDGLRKKFAEVFGEPTRSRHKQYLVKRIIWRMQANAEGGLSERALRRAMELANDADLRLSAPKRQTERQALVETITKEVPATQVTRLLPGTMLKRDYKGRTLKVTVLADGFEFEGDRYKSLTAVAKSATGKHWNGYHFFGLREKRGAE
jgi:hypothetical protein